MQPARISVGSSSVELCVAARTDRGIVRHENEDACLVVDLGGVSGPADALHVPITERGVLLAVADGMGGVRGGGIASGIATAILGQAVAREHIECSEGSLKAAFLEANAAVREAATELELCGMGTTLTALHVGTRFVQVAHVGDSRAYLARGDLLLQLTRDDTVVQRWVDGGRLTKEEARRSRHAHILSQALGTDPRVRASTVRFTIEDGDRLLVCSDGLWGVVEDDDILRVLASEGSCHDAADALVARANERGGPDNVTAVVAHVSCGPARLRSGTHAIHGAR